MISKLIEPHLLQNIKAKKILCHGVFDIIHVGHIRYFKEAKKLGDILIVSITKDEFIKKGPGRPYFKLSDRIEQIQSLDIVDYIVVSDDSSACNVIEKIKPAKYCKGIEYKHTDIAGNLNEEIHALKRVGGEISFITHPKIVQQKFFLKHLLVQIRV
jgi:rfaE bifunctional protein nucleotidyltransferase chain/domain